MHRKNKEMKWIRKIALVIVLVLCVSFTACGRNGKNESSNPATNSIDDHSSETTTPDETEDSVDDVEEMSVEEEVVIELEEDEKVGGL